MPNLNGSYGKLRISRSRSTMDDFDRLPRPLRDALNDAVTIYGVGWVIAKLKKGVSVENLVKTIKAGDAQIIATTNEQREADTFLKNLGL